MRASAPAAEEVEEEAAVGVAVEEAEEVEEVVGAAEAVEGREEAEAGAAVAAPERRDSYRFRCR
jgi:hypothetical protein